MTLEIKFWTLIKISPLRSVLTRNEKLRKGFCKEKKSFLECLCSYCCASNVALLRYSSSSIKVYSCCTHTHTHTHTYIYIYINIYTYINIYIYILYKKIHTFTQINTQTSTHTHTHKNVYIIIYTQKWCRPMLLCIFSTRFLSSPRYSLRPHTQVAEGLIH